MIAAVSASFPPLAELWHLAVLAIVQGVTEFLSISSSAHLILVPKLTGWTIRVLASTSQCNIGTLGAVVL